MNYIEQSKEWGKFQEKLPGRGKFWLLEIADSRGGISEVLLVRQKLPMNRCWIWCPRGPQFEDMTDETAWHNFSKEARSIALQEKAIFLRVEPPTLENDKIKWPQGFKNAHDHYLPEHTIILDISKSEEDILAQMKPKCRYNIRLAEKKAVTIQKSKIGTSTGKSDIEKFYKILSETTGRDGFKGHPKKYYEDMLETLGAESMVELFIAEHEGEAIAGIIATYYKDTATYYFGASGDAKRDLMAPYLLQWEAIKEAKKRGCKYYDLLGVAPIEAGKSHPWAGISEFKRKFGGEELAYQKAKEFIYSPLWFKGMKIYKKLR